MQTVTITYPHPKFPAMTTGDGPITTTEVRLELRLTRENESDWWRIVEATTAELATYVNGSKQGIGCDVTADRPEDWMDWLTHPDTMSQYGMDIERQADEQWERDCE